MKTSNFFQNGRRGCLLVLLVLGLAFISGCSSTDSSIGIFVDSPVAGLNYSTPTISGGTTNVNGNFAYYGSETVTFSIGNLQLGSSAGKATVTPSDIVSGATGVTDQRVSNIGRLLQTLDEDGDLNNGIKINAQTAAIVSAKASGLNFDQTEAVFSADPKVVALLAALNLNNAAGFTSGEVGGRMLRSAADAQAHMQASVSARKQVTTANGIVSGYAAPNGAWAWKGVPYAKPPVGSLRWKAPEDPGNWNGVREATAFCSKCVQADADKYWRFTGTYSGREDCLYLDIYHPGGNATNLPVSIWIHGGSNNIGNSKDYEATNLAKQSNIVVVNIQYRLNTFGWLSHPALRASAVNTSDASGNFGTLDHIKALTWVKNNIAAFGGNPNQITVGGESAGGHNTYNLMIMSPMTSGLFQQAFTCSAAVDGVMSLRTVSAGDTVANKEIDWLLIQDGLATDATSAANYRAAMSNAQIETFLRSKTALQLSQAYRSGAGNPMAAAFRDGNVIRDNTLMGQIATGTYNKLPLLIGTNRDEWKAFMGPYGPAFKAYFGVPTGSRNWADIYSVLDGILSLNDVLPVALDQNFYDFGASLKSRQWKYYAVDGIARALKTNDPSNKVYAYQLNWDGGGDPALANFKFLIGAAHATDIYFWFNVPGDIFGLSSTTANKAGEDALKSAMSSYLSSFVNTGNPNQAGSSLPIWPQWSNTGGDAKMMTFDANLSGYLINTSAYEESLSAITEDRNAGAAIYPAGWMAGLTVLFGL